MTDMTRLYETRADNLRALIRQTDGGATTIARALGHANRSFVGQMSQETPRRRVTEKTARAIEEVFGLPPGWMDE